MQSKETSYFVVEFVVSIFFWRIPCARMEKGLMDEKGFLSFKTGEKHL